MQLNKNPKIRLFRYYAKVKRGKPVTKVIAAENKAEAVDYVKKVGQSLIKIKDITPFFILDSKIPEFEFISILMKFSTYIKSSMSPVNIITSLLNEEYSYQTKIFLATLRDSFKEGLPAYIAFKKTGLIDNQISQLIQIGEKTGTLPTTLIEIAKLLEKKALMKKSLKKSLVRPVFTIIFAFAIVAFVVPSMIEPIKGIFTSVGKGEIPMLTKIVLGVTDYIKANGFYVFYGMVMGIASFIWIYTTNLKAKAIFDKMLLNMPIIGRFIQISYNYIIFVTLNMFVQSGFALPQALKEISSSINNLEMKEDLNAVNIEVKNGLPLSKAIMQSVYIPDIYKETFASGEKTGSLKADLLKTIDLINEHFEEESKKVISKITMTISLFVSAIVGIVVFAVYMPMFSLIGAINQSMAG